MPFFWANPFFDRKAGNTSGDIILAMWVFEWTGEQFLPATMDASVVYRKIHSYLFAAQFVNGRSVLDARAGDGSGANVLAQNAASVVAVVTDERLAAQANEKHGKPGLQFTPVLGGGQFDVVVCFDAPPAFDLKRLIKPEGLLIASASSPESLRDQLQPHFRHVQLFGQSDQTGSWIWPLDEASAATSQVEMLPGPMQAPASAIAIASDAAFAPPRSLNVLVDQTNELLKDRDQRIQELIQNEACRQTVARQHESQLADRRESLAHLQEAVAWHETRIASLTEARDFMEREVGHYRKAFESAEEALAWRKSQVESLTAGLAARGAEVESLHATLHATLHSLEGERLRVSELARELEAIKASRGWQWVLRLRKFRASLTG